LGLEAVFDGVAKLHHQKLVFYFGAKPLYIAVASLVRIQTQEVSGGAARRHSLLGF
jgi:hypothetical protein